MRGPIKFLAGKMGYDIEQEYQAASDQERSKVRTVLKMQIGVMAAASAISMYEAYEINPLIVSSNSLVLRGLGMAINLALKAPVAIAGGVAGYAAVEAGSMLYQFSSEGEG